MKRHGLATIATMALGLAIAHPLPAAVTISIEAARVMTTTISGYTLGLANLDSATNGLPTVAFAGSPVTGSTTNGFVNIYDANVFGGAGGTGRFGSVTGQATIQLSSAVNYFGLWGSALDGQNTVALYSNDTLVGSYALQSILESSPGFNSGYRGNPVGGGNSGEEYAFFNFVSDTPFNRVGLIQNAGGGFEFDNLTIGTALVSATPEPSTWAMLLLGFGAIGYCLRAKRNAGHAVNV
jgi:hypothetical protein